MTNPSKRIARRSRSEPYLGETPLPNERRSGTAGEDTPESTQADSGAKPGFEPGEEIEATADDLARAAMERALVRAIDALHAEQLLLLKHRRLL